LQAGAAAGDPRWIEAGRTQMPRHSVGDDLIVLDDQHFRHAANPAGRIASDGFAAGERLVNGR
jgi:hypothetical protein